MKLSTSKIVYFDYNATAPLLEEVKEGMSDLINEGLPANPSSVHALGRASKSLIEKARFSVMELMAADKAYQVVFTSCGTESNNLALKGLARYRTITSVIEHPSVLNVAGAAVIPVRREGVVHLDAIEEYCQQLRKQKEEPFLVSIMLANNETGVIQPLKEVAQIVHKYGGIVHTDAAQAFGKIPVEIRDLDVDLVSISAHKLGGPAGAAALVYKNHLELEPLLLGGGQEYRRRSGTQNVLAIHGFGIACRAAQQRLPEFAKLKKLRNALEKEVLTIAPSTVIFGSSAPRLPNTSSLSMAHINATTQIMHFDLNNIAVSAGSACSSSKVGSPHVQMSMGYTEEIASTAIRVSLGLSNTQTEVEKFLKVWAKLYKNSEAYSMQKVA